MMSNDLTISEVLRGMTPGRLQTVGVMQVLPLIGDSDLFDDKIISPQNSEHKTTIGTRGYGSMEFKNPNDKVLLVPCHVGYVVKQAAQNHAMANCGLIGKKKDKTYDNAMCIQQSQGGMIQHDQHRMLILPYSLRERALALRGQKEFGKLWSDIAVFNTEMGIRSGTDRGHLEYFLEHFKKELDEFVAEFECLGKQTGAIILIDGHVVGVERGPNPTFWRDVWDALIRECYGSLAIKVAKDQGDRPKTPKTRVPFHGRFESLGDIERGLRRVREEEEEKTKEIIRKLLDEPFECEKEDELAGYKIFTVKNDQFTGQVVRDSGKVSYCSLFTTKTWAKNAPWREASKFAV